MFQYLQSRIEVPFHSSRKQRCSHICRVEQKFHSILLENGVVPISAEQNRSSIPFFQKIEMFPISQSRIEIPFHSSRKWSCSHTCRVEQKFYSILLENGDVPAKKDRSPNLLFQIITMFPYLQSKIEVHPFLLENETVLMFLEQDRNSIPFFQKMEMFPYLQSRIEILFHSSRKWRCSHTCKEGQKSQPIVLDNEIVSIFAEQDLSSSYSSRK